MGVILAPILQLVKLCIFGFALAVQESKGYITFPSPASFPVIPPREETPSPTHNGESWGSSPLSSPSNRDGFSVSPSPATLSVYTSPGGTPGPLHPRHSWSTFAPSSPALPNVTLLPPTSAPAPQKIKGIEPSISPSPSTITLLPPYELVPSPSTLQVHVPPTVLPSPPQGKAPAGTPSVFTPVAPVAIPSVNLPKTSPVSQPTEHGSLPPSVYKGNENKSHTPEPISPAPVRQPTERGSLPAHVDKGNENKSHTAEPISPAPVSRPTEHGSLPPNVDRGNENKSYTPEPISPAPVSQPTEGGSLPAHVDKGNENKSHTTKPISPAPVRQPTEHGSLPPHVDKGNENKSHTPAPISPAPVSQPTEQGSLPPNADKGNENKSHTPEQISPAPVSQPTEHGSLPPNVNKGNKNKSHTPERIPPASVSQPTEHGSLPPNVNKGNENKSHTPEPISPAPVAIPSVNLPRSTPISQPTEHGSLPKVHKGKANKGHNPEPASPAPVAIRSTDFPKNSPVGQPTDHGTLSLHRRNASTVHSLGEVSPAPVAIPPANLPKNSPDSQPTEHGMPPNVHKRTANKGHIPEPVSSVSVASPPMKVGPSPPETPPILPKITPSILPAPVTSPTSAFPVKSPSVLPFLPGMSPSKLPAPIVSPTSTPSRRSNWKKAGAPVAAPLYWTPKPLPAVIHSPAQAPAAHNVRQFHHAPEPSSSYNKEYHSPASPPSTSFHNHYHTRNMVASPAPAPLYLISPPTSQHQDQAITPSLLPTSSRRHNAPSPVNPGFPVSPFSFPILSPMSQVSPASSPAFKISPHPTAPFVPPKKSPSGSSPKSPQSPVLHRIQALPPPPPNEDCLSTVCSEPYANSPPGAPCRCVLPMQVGLRLSVSLYTFFPLVSELASEIASGVFMKQSQVRIMGANAASQQQDKTIVLIDLVPLGEKFDYTTAFLTSERFWHKQVVINASYFGDYEVLYVSYPGLPPSPPLPPSSISIIDGGPYAGVGNNGGTLKPLGVDIPKRRHKGGLKGGIIAIIALSVFLAVVLCSAAAWVLLLKRRDHVSQPASTPRVLPPSLTKSPGIAGSLIGGGPISASSSFRSSIAAYAGSAKTFSINDIERATDNFHASKILGEGGFGRVYSGILEDGTKVAVKVLKREDHHGDREFLAEVEMLSRLHHRNLVKLIGICTVDSFRCLVYELIPNGSVESHLHGVHSETSPLDWGARLKIALGAARGLAYLHEDSSPRVIHRDFKSSNILLEDDFTPKVSDFGLARTAADEENRHISTRVMGTFGYVAPEYAMTGHLLVKSDVYSYGVVLLELLTGRKPVDMSQPPGQENLVAWARPLLTSKEGLEAIKDPCLGSGVPFESVAKVAAIASMCVQPEVSNRPFMGEVVQALKLVCNECDEAKEVGSRSSSLENLSVDLDMGVITASGQLPDNFQSQYSAPNYDLAVDVERGLSASELFSSSARIGRQSSGSFRRHSYSGPLRTGRSRRLWQIIRRLSGGSVSEHGIMFKL